jgi:hypothetical protein
VLFKELVEQHCIHGFVPDGVDLAVFIANHQVRVDLGYFLGNQTIFRPIRPVSLVVEGYRLKREEVLARFVHRFDVLLESDRRAYRAKLAGGVDHYGYGVVEVRCHPADVANQAGVTDIFASVTNTDHVAGRGDEASGYIADDCVKLAGGQAKTRDSTNRRVEATGGDRPERTNADCRIFIPSGAVVQSVSPNRHVAYTVNAVKEGKGSKGCVSLTSVVENERVSSNGRVVEAGAVEQQGSSAHCGIGIAVIEGQRSAAHTRVETAGGVQKERTPTECCISSTGGEEVKRIAAFRCREIGITVRCRGGGWRWRGCRCGCGRRCVRGRGCGGVRGCGRRCVRGRG